MNNFEIGVLSPITLAFVEISKGLGLPKKWAPVLAIIVGIGFSFMVGTGNIAETIITGCIIGFTACGLWDVGKKTAQAVVEKKIDGPKNSK